MPLFNRSLIAVSIGCLNILTYSVVCGVILINLKYDQYSEYDYNDHNDVYDSYKQRREAQALREIYGSVYVTMCIVMDVLSGFLIWGVVEKRPRFIAPWILAAFVVLVYSVIVVMEDIFVKSSFQKMANMKPFFGILFIGFVIQLFCLFVIYTLYKDMELEIFLNLQHSQTKGKERKVEAGAEENQQRRGNNSNKTEEPNQKLKKKVKSRSKKKDSTK